MKKKIITIAVMINGGKSGLLNALFNFYFLESISGKGTEFINF